MTDAVTFHYENGGYSYNPATETSEQGRIRCAHEAAAAEVHAATHGWLVRWCDDPIVQDHHYAPDGVQSCEHAALTDATGEVLASLGCIDDADDNYRRVVAADLTIEAMMPA
jgi:hypothetical protein